MSALSSSPSFAEGGGSRVQGWCRSQDYSRNPNFATDGDTQQLFRAKFGKSSEMGQRVNIIGSVGQEGNGNYHCRYSHNYLKCSH